MALPIIEQPLYGEILIETAPWASPFVWTNRTAELVAGLTYSEGGRVGQPGESPVEVGTLNATFKDMSSVPNVGALVRISFSRVSGYAFTGYVQDVSQRIVFDDSVSYNTPITLTTLNCLDWVGYISQFQAVGAGGNQPSTGAIDTDSQYRWYDRVAALNKIIDPTYSTEIIDIPPYVTNEKMLVGDTDFVGSIAEHLDLLVNTTGIRWNGSHLLPTNTTTGRTGLIEIDRNASPSIVKTFTDVAGSAGQLHYTEIDFENSTQNVANTIVVENRVRFNVPDVEVTKIGGFNEENYMIINSTNVVGVAVNGTEQKSDATSITSYGNRQSVIQTNAGMPVSSSGSFNLIANPSVEYSDDGYSGDGNIRARRRQPSQDANPFAAYNGLWAIRSRQRTANNAAVVTYSGGESDGIPVVAGTTYYLTGRAARGVTSRTDARFQMQINWYDENETIISTITSGSTVTLTTTNTWYSNSISGAAPAGAVRATVAVRFTRPGALLHQVGDLLWADALILSKTTDAYFDGDTPWDATNAYIWTGGVGSSPSYKLLNYVDDLADEFLAQYSTTSNRATRIRWNAQESLTSVPTLQCGRDISLIFDGTTTSYRIIGINATIDPERYMIDYYLRKL